MLGLGTVKSSFSSNVILAMVKKCADCGQQVILCSNATDYKNLTFWPPGMTEQTHQIQLANGIKFGSRSFWSIEIESLHKRKIIINKWKSVKVNVTPLMFLTQTNQTS